MSAEKNLLFAFFFSLIFCPSIACEELFSPDTDLNNQGVLAAQAGNFEEGVFFLRQALELNPTDSSVRRNLSGVLTDWSAALNTQGKRKEALEALQEAYGLDPKNGIAAALLADHAYLVTGDIPAAIRLWKEAYATVALESQEGIRRRLSQAERDVNVERAFESLTTEHFLIRFEGESDPAAIQSLGEILEGLTQRLVGTFGSFPKTTQIIVYGQSNFERIAGRRDWTLGLYDGRVRLRLEDLGTDTLDSILSHELTHAYLSQTVGNAIPTWVHEGLAQVMEPDRTLTERQRQLLIGIKERTAWVPLKWLDRRFEQPSDLEDLEKAYVQSLYVVEFLVQKQGIKRFLSFLKAISSGKSMEAAFDQTFSPVRWNQIDQGSF